MPRLGVSSVYSRILLLKLDLRINFGNCFIDQRRTLFVLHCHVSCVTLRLYRIVTFLLLVFSRGRKRLYQKSVCKECRTRLQSSATGFLMSDQRHRLHSYPWYFRSKNNLNVYLLSDKSAFLSFHVPLY